MPANRTSHGAKRCGAGLVRTRCEYIHVRSAPAIHGGRRSFPAPPRSAWRQPCAMFRCTPILTTRHHPGRGAELRSRLVGSPDFPLRYFPILQCPPQPNQSPPPPQSGSATLALRVVTGRGQGGTDRRPPGMAGAEPTGTYSWRVRPALPPASDRPKNPSVTLPTHVPHRIGFRPQRPSKEPP